MVWVKGLRMDIKEVLLIVSGDMGGHMRKHIRALISLLIIFILLTSNMTFALEDQLGRPRVLIIRSLDNVRYDMRKIMSGFQTELDTKEVQMDFVDIHVKYLSDPGYSQSIGSMIKSMIQSGGEYDLLILIREPAIRYALSAEDLIKDTPIVFGMMQNEKLSVAMHNKFNSVQVTEPLLLRENLLVAQTINENVNTVHVVLDRIMADSNIELEVKRQSDIFNGEVQVEIHYSEDILSGDESLQTLPLKDSMIYYMSEHRTSNILNLEKNYESIVLTPWLSLVKNEVDGGRILDSERYGELIGEKARAVLDGIKPSEIEMSNVSSEYVFDYINIQNKGVDLDWIEKEVVYLNFTNSGMQFGALLYLGIGVLILAVFALIIISIKHYLDHHQDAQQSISPFSDDIIENVDTAISIKNEDRKYIHVNHKFKELFELEGDIIDRNDKEIFKLEFSDALKSIDDRATFGSDDYEKKIIFNDSKNGALYLDFKVKKVKDKMGRMYLVSYVYDLTEQKKHEKTLAELNKLLEQQVRDRTGELIQSEKMAMLGTLVAGVSHEISTPIGVSITASTFLSDQSQQVKKQFESGTLKRSDMVGFIEMLEETGKILFNNLSNAAEMITNFKKVAVDQASEEIREFNLKDYSRGVVMNLKPKFKHTQHKIHVNGDEDIVLYSYPGALNQIMTNLILNSLIHGFENKESGEITISIQQLEERMWARIEYVDNGHGISRENVDKIFDPFFTTKRGRGGSGLGMNIVRNLVEKTLNGTIEVHSDTGQGVRFVIEFPQRINVYEKNNPEM